MIRLNGWHRIGIVLSTTWLLLGAIWGNNVGLSEGDYVRENYNLCLADATARQREACSSTYVHDWPVAIQYHWWYAAIFAILPILLAWPSIYFVLFVVRWIRRGFNPKDGVKNAK